jgi:endoglycosylceramidase
MTAAIRAVDQDAFVFSEPFVLFNFGRSDTSLSGFGAPAAGLSFHVYALTPEEDEATIDRAIAASARGDALLATEFGATTDPGTLDRLTAAFDTRLVPWIFWSYDENLVIDLSLPPDPANVRQPVLAALARPYATATNGLPTSYGFEPATGVLDYAYATSRPDGSVAPAGVTTVLAMPPTAYPDGYTVQVTGAGVVSAPDATELVLCNDPGASSVVVRVVPGSDPAPPAPVTCAAEPPPPSTTSVVVPSTLPVVPAAPVPPAAPAAVPVATRPAFTG